MSIWIAGWFAVAFLCGAVILVFDPQSKGMTNGDVLKLAIFCLLAWPLVVLVYLYVRLEEGAFGEWLAKPFYKNSSE